MNEDLGLRLNLTADTKSLERDIKALSKSLIASLTLDLNKAKAQLDNLNTTLESKTFKTNLTVDVKPANTAVKGFKNSVEASPLKLTDISLQIK